MSKALAPLLSPAEFVGLDGVTHLCSGGEGPWLVCQSQIYKEFARLTSDGHAGREQVYERAECCRRRMGELWQVPGQRVAFMPHAAEAMNWLARGLEWRAGDNIVTTSLEFPSVAYAWKRLRAAGVEVRRVRHTNWTVGEEALLDACDRHTRVLAVSQVSYLSGECLNVERLSSALRATDTLLAVDATHASGVIKVPAAFTDLCVSSAYKWMLGTHGVAPCYMSPRMEARCADSCFGWHNLDIDDRDAAMLAEDIPLKSMPQRLEPGNPAMLAIMFLHRALGVLLEIGAQRIEDHARELALRVNRGLQELGCAVISPSAKAQRSGNTCFLVADPAALRDQLAEQRVLVWGDHSRVRVSTHLYNASHDVEQFLRVMAGLKG